MLISTAPVRCAQIASFMPGADGHLLYNAADPGYHKLSLLDVVEGSFLHAGAAPGWPTCHRVAVCNNVGGVLAVSAIVSQTGACVCATLSSVKSRSVGHLAHPT